MSIEDTPEVDIETVTSNVGDKCHGTINQAFSWLNAAKRLYALGFILYSLWCNLKNFKKTLW